MWDMEQTDLLRMSRKLWVGFTRNETFWKDIDTTGPRCRPDSVMKREGVIIQRPNPDKVGPG